MAPPEQERSRKARAPALPALRQYNPRTSRKGARPSNNFSIRGTPSCDFYSSQLIPRQFRRTVQFQFLRMAVTRMAENRRPRRQKAETQHTGSGVDHLRHELPENRENLAKSLIPGSSVRVQASACPFFPRFNENAHSNPESSAYTERESENSLSFHSLPGP